MGSKYVSRLVNVGYVKRLLLQDNWSFFLVSLHHAISRVSANRKAESSLGMSTHRDVTV